LSVSSFHDYIILTKSKVLLRISQKWKSTGGCLFCAKLFYVVPIYSLDQTDTYKVDKLQAFIETPIPIWVFVREKWNGKGVTGKNREKRLENAQGPTVSDFKSALLW
jgi:hypothetical protein